MNDLHLQFLFYLNAFWARRWCLIGVAWVLCALGWAAVTLIPDVYTSTARIYVDTASVLQPLLRGLAVDLDSDVNAQVNLMKRTLLSRPNLIKVARMTSADLAVPSESELSAVADQIGRATSVAGGRDDLFTISFDGPSPIEARDIVDALVTIFIETNVGANRIDLDQARQFIDEQIRSYEAQLELAEQRTARFKQANMDLLPGAAGYHGRLERARTELASAKAELGQAMTRREVLARELELVPEFLEFQSDEDISGLGPPTDQESRIMEMEFQLRGLLSSYTESHPDVVLLRRKLDALHEERDRELQAQQTASLDQPESEGNESISRVKFRTYNPAYPQLRVRLLEEDARIESLRKSVEQKHEEVVSLENLAAQVPLIEAENAKLNRDYLVLSNKYQELLARREAARISHEREVLRAERTQFRIVEPPRLPDSPSGPNRAMFLAAATLLGFGASVALVGGLVVLDQTFRAPTQLARAFGRPLIGMVMMVPSARERLLQPAGLCAFLLVAAALPSALGGLLYLERQFGLGNLAASGPVAKLTSDLPPALNSGT